jgi:hypothetical protein
VDPLVFRLKKQAVRREVDPLCFSNISEWDGQGRVEGLGKVKMWLRHDRVYYGVDELE